jgi:hypothetical protein
MNMHVSTSRILTWRHFALALLAAVMSATASLHAGEAPPGFTALFNGRNLDGWRGGKTFDHREFLQLTAEKRDQLSAEWTRTMFEVNPKTGKPHWSVEGEVLVNDGEGGYATTGRDFGDFELLLEYRTVSLADSGVYLRGIPQVQIWDSTSPDPTGLGRAKGSGGLWNNAAGSPGRDPLVRADRPFGEWNSLRVLMTGQRVSVWLNGSLVVDQAILENYFDRKLPVAERRPIPERGPIQLQTHGGEISWRNIFIREIPPSPAKP